MHNERLKLMPDCLARLIRSVRRKEYIMVRKTKSGLSPHRKISETFLDFSRLIIDSMGREATKDQVEQVLKISFTVWNAVVLDTVNGTSQYISKIRELTSGDPISAALIEQIISRKQAMFSDDYRLIGEYRLTQKNSEWRLWAEARDPWTID